MENICANCRSIFTGKGRVACPNNPHHKRRRRYYHHRNLSSFKAAAEAGCDICCALVKSLPDEERRGQRSHPISYYIHDEYNRTLISPGYTVSFELSGGRCRSLKITRQDQERFVRVSELAKQTVSSNTGSDESLDIASQWILECISNHKHCNRAAKPTNVETPLPTRLLYIGTLGDQSVRLCNTKLLPDDTQYMTLSHCWGQLQLTTLTNSNIATFQEGLATSKLPKTFRDAIYVAQKMSVQYIWIDSLCIIQDAEDDWTKESAHMMSVYAGAFCNIAATAAPDARTGLFFDRDVSIPRARVLEIPPRPVCPPFQSFLIKLFRSLKAIPKATVNRMVRKGWFKSKASFHLDLQNVPFFETGKYSIEGLGLYGRDLHTSPLMKRAWVLQEQLLAKRTLHFTSTQVYFGCQEHMISEIFADSIYSIHSLGRGLLQDSEHTDSESLAAPGSSSSAASTTSSASTASSFSSVASRANAASPWQQLRFTESDRRPLTRIMALDRWCEIIRIYTDLDLTYETDRQVAISGVVRCLDPSMNCKYVAGIWDHEVELQLLWQCLDDWKRTSVSKVPSWSWASSPGPVLHAISVYNIRTHIRPDLFKVLGIEAKPKEEDNNSPMNNCHLRVVGRLTPVTLTNDSQWPQPGRPNTVKIRKESFRFTPDKFCGPGKYYSSTLLYYVQENRYCTSVDGLIWTPTGKKRGEFQRVGLFSGNWKRLCSIRELDDLGACVCGRGDAREKAQMTEDLYETYDEEKDVYTFTIV